MGNRMSVMEKYGAPYSTNLILILLVFLILTHNLYLETESERETEWVY